MQQLYIKYEFWNKNSFNMAIAEAKRMWYTEYETDLAEPQEIPVFDWYAFIWLDNEWQYWISYRDRWEKDLKSMWFKLHKMKHILSI